MRYRCPRSSSTSRVNLLRRNGSCGAIRLAELNGAALLDVVARVHRELGDDVALDHRLAAEARLRRQVPGRVEAIGLVVLHLTEVRHALADDQVAGRTRTAPAAGVLERDAGAHREIQEG